MTVIEDENFEDFVSNWELFRGRLTVFLGAGASIGALNAQGHALPSAYDLRNELWERFKHGPASAFRPEDLKLMSLEHAAAIIEAKTGRIPMSEFLVERFTCKLPLWQHVALPYLDPKSIFTTNYDELIELGYKSSPVLTDVVCDGRTPAHDRTAIFKPHGSLTHAGQPIGSGGLVITQFDYFEMISAYRKMLKNSMEQFEARCVVLIGYSFGDMDIGAELYAIRQKTKGIPWYAVFPRNDRQVRKMYSDRFNINQINMTFEQFMKQLDARVNFAPKPLKHSNIAAMIAEGRLQSN